MTLHGFTMTRAIRKISALALAVLAILIGEVGAGEDRQSHGRWSPNASVDVGVDALGLIEWWEQREHQHGRFATRSSVNFRADSQTLLFHCGAGAALVVSRTPLAANGSTDVTKRSAFRCQAEEALYGDPGGGVSCISFAGRIGHLPAGPVEIVINEAGPVALAGICMDSHGAVVPAFMPQSLSDWAPGPALAPTSSGECAKTQSSVSFRGKRRNAACAP